MTKAEYEANKAARKVERDKIIASDKSDDMMPGLLLDMLDRFVTAVERIADAMEKA